MSRDPAELRDFIETFVATEEAFEARRWLPTLEAELAAERAAAAEQARKDRDIEQQFQAAKAVATRTALFAFARAHNGHALAAEAARMARSLPKRLVGNRLAIFHREPRFETTSHLWSACISPDWTRVATAASGDVSVRVWNAKTGEQLLALGGHDRGAHKAKFSPDGARLMTTPSSGNILRIWDVVTGDPLITIKTPGSWANDAVYSPDGRSLATVSTGERSVACVWSASDGRKICDMHGHASESFDDLCFSPDGRRLVTASRDNSARLWDAHSGKSIAALQHGSWVRSACFNPTGDILLTVAREAHLWSGTDGRKIASLSDVGQYGEFSTAGDRFLIADYRSVHVFDTRGANKIAQLPLTPDDNENQCGRASFSKDGQFVVVGCQGLKSHTYLWRTSDWSQIASFGEHRNGDSSELAASFSPEGKRVFVAGHYAAHAGLWELTEEE